MKVCTDACLFGALLPPNPLPFDSAQDEGELAVLDIGAGTGLLSLMYAQKDQHAIIDAIEIDPSAALQAKKNFESSPWKGRLKIFNTDVNLLKSDKKYERIISNPPFFEDDLRSPDETKNAAKHNGSLSLIQLLEIVNKQLGMQGTFAVLLPYLRVAYFENEATKHALHLSRKILVRQTPRHELFRGILFFSKEKSEQKLTEMSIKRTDGTYTAEFTALLKDYYLHL